MALLSKVRVLPVSFTPQARGNDETPHAHSGSNEAGEL